jgi:hypothetical protein
MVKRKPAVDTGQFEAGGKEMNILAGKGWNR